MRVCEECGKPVDGHGNRRMHRECAYLRRRRRDSKTYGLTEEERMERKRQQRIDAGLANVERLRRSSVPSPLIADVIASYHTGTVGDLARKVGIEEDTLWRHMDGQRQFISFNTADRILCALGVPMLWHADPLKDVYQNIQFEEKECARPGCSRPVVPGKFTPKTGPKAKRFCSSDCRVAEAA